MPKSPTLPTQTPFAPPPPPMSYHRVATQQVGYTKHGYVVDAAKKFAGNLDWKEVKIGPRAGTLYPDHRGHPRPPGRIKDVVDAIEQVEGKVDELVKLMRAKRLGTAIGDRQTLQSAVDLLDKSGTITGTDWTALGPLGPEIARDIERLRARIGLKLAEVKSGARVRTWVDEVEELSEELLRESMAYARCCRTQLRVVAAASNGSHASA
jgi:hypothetical protein